MMDEKKEEEEEVLSKPNTLSTTGNASSH